MSFACQVLLGKALLIFGPELSGLFSNEWEGYWEAYLIEKVKLHKKWSELRLPNVFVFGPWQPWSSESTPGVPPEAQQVKFCNIVLSLRVWYFCIWRWSSCVLMNIHSQKWGCPLFYVYIVRPVQWNSTKLQWLNTEFVYMGDTRLRAYIKYIHIHKNRWS